MPGTHALMSVVKSIAITCLVGVAGAPSLAQPATFVDLGPVSAAATPPSARQYAHIPPLFNLIVPELFDVRWVRFDLLEPIAGDLFLDINTGITSIFPPRGDVFLAIYNDAGELVVTNDNDNTLPAGSLNAALSFGSGAPRANGSPFFSGQDGELPAGRYWLAVAAGGAAEVTAGPVNWELTTTASYEVAYLNLDTLVYYVELYIDLGNTTPPPPPPNDDCTGALPVGEDTAAGPAWTGVNDGATTDGTSPCYQAPPLPGLSAKDIWFLYTPSTSGLAEIVADCPPGGGLDPIITSFEAGCGSAPAQCSGFNGFLSSLPGVRLYVPVIAGEPVLLSLSSRIGGSGPLILSIRIVPPPCPLQIPAGAVAESEAACGDSSNDGCNVSPAAFDPLTLGQTVYGTLFLADFTRDTDWFEFNLDQPSEVTVTFSAQHPADAVILGPEISPGGCFGNPILVLEGPGFSGACGTTSGSIELPTGSHRVAINHSLVRTGLNCGDGYEGYWLRVDARGVNPPCRADYNGDGTLDPDDLSDFVTCYFSIPPCDQADFSGDGAADPDDLSDFITAFFAGC